jgi:hypothetical protein
MLLSPGKALTGKALKEALKAIPRKDRSVIGDEAANAALARALVGEGLDKLGDGETASFQDVANIPNIGRQEAKVFGKHGGRLKRD